MRVLIVESNTALGGVWRRHLERQGHSVDLVETQTDAVDILRHHRVQILVVDVVLEQGSALAIADFASYRRPEARVVFVTNTTFFSDGSIFQHAANACAFLTSDTDPEDLTMMIEHFGQSAA